MKARILIFVLGLVTGAAGMFLAESYWAGRWPFGDRSVDIDLPDRPAEWAESIYEEELPNFHKVSDDLYRGAQPTAEGMKKLHALGVKTIVNLRAAHSDRDEIGRLPLGYEHIRMTAWDAEDEDVVRFLKIVTDEKKAPVFVHCKYGSDRTGTMCAIYRILVCGWTKEEAIREMTEGEFGFHGVWSNLPRYIRRLDVERIRADALGREAPR